MPFCELEVGHGGVGVVGKADAVDAVGRFELTRCYQRRAVIAGDDLVIDRA